MIWHRLVRSHAGWIRGEILPRKVQTRGHTGRLGILHVGRYLRMAEPLASVWYDVTLQANGRGLSVPSLPCDASDILHSIRLQSCL